MFPANRLAQDVGILGTDGHNDPATDRQSGQITLKHAHSP